MKIAVYKLVFEIYLLYWLNVEWAFCSACPAGFDFVVGANGCYQSVNELLNWTAASARCQQLYNGAYSVIINNAVEQDAISSYINAAMNQSRSSSS